MDSIEFFVRDIRDWCYEPWLTKDRYQLEIDTRSRTALVMVPEHQWGVAVQDWLLHDRAFRRRKTSNEMVFIPTMTMIWFGVERRSVCGRSVDRVFIHPQCNYDAYLAAKPCEIPRRKYARIRNR